MLSKRSREGYFVIDHMASPGTPAVPEGTVFESATITCSHCNTVVVLNPDRSRARGYCRSCDHYVCDAPACNRDCTSMEARLDKMQENAYRALKSGVLVPR